MQGAEISGSPPGGVLFRTSRTRDPEIQVHGAKLTRPLPTIKGRFLPVCSLSPASFDMPFVM